MRAVFLTILLVPLSFSVQNDTQFTPSCNLSNMKKFATCASFPRDHFGYTTTALKIRGKLQEIRKEMISDVIAHLKVLDIRECNIVNIESGAFDKIKNLQTLYLSRNEIEVIQEDLFKENSTIEHLHLDRNKLTSIKKKFFKNLTNLKELHLQGNQLTQAPSPLPRKLRYLDLSNNNIKYITTLFHEEMLEHLDLCGNKYTELPQTISVKTNLTTLCLGNSLLTVKNDIIESIPKIFNFSLVANPNANALMNAVTQSALAKMSTLELLTIVNYKMDSFTFLHNLTKLRILKLWNVTVNKGVKVDTMFNNSGDLLSLFLDGSPTLISKIFANQQAALNLTHLLRLSLQNSGLKHIPLIQVPKKTDFKMDIENNPLHCDCDIVALNASLENKLDQYLLNADQTLCKTPKEAFQKTLVSYMYNVDCSQDKNYTSLTTVYITLGVILLTLLFTVCAFIIYYAYRKRVKRSTHDGPCELSFQQLKLSISEESLL